MRRRRRRRRCGGIGRVRNEKPGVHAREDRRLRRRARPHHRREAAAPAPAGVGAAGEEGGEEDEEAERLQIDASTVRFLREAREALAGFVTSEDGSAPATADGWRAEAVRRWGDAVKADDWEVYVTSRLSAPPQTRRRRCCRSGTAPTVWRLLCCCLTMSRVSSGATKHRAEPLRAVPALPPPSSPRRPRRRARSRCSARRSTCSASSTTG